MNIKEMIEACAAGLEVGAVTLTIPKGKRPPGFPRGELLCEVVRDGVLIRNYRFNPLDVLLWMRKQGLIQIDMRGAKVTISGPPA